MNDHRVMLEFSPDANSHLLAEGSSDIVIWNVLTHQQVKRLNTPGKVIAFSPDGKRLASSTGVAIILWDTATWQPVGQPLRAHAEAVSALAFSPDGKMLASADGKEIRLWDTTTQQPIREPLSHGALYDYSKSVWFSPDGRQMFSYSHIFHLLIWDLEARPPAMRDVDNYLSPGEVAFSSQRMLFAHSDDASTTVVHVVDKRKLEIDYTWAMALSFSPDGKLLAASQAPYGEPAGVYLFDVGNP